MGPQFFINRPRFAFVISIVITLAGVLSLFVMPVDQYPDITAPKVVVTTNYPGASAQAVKDTVAAVIENEVNGTEGMAYMSSNSASDGSYVLTITFEIGVDPYLAQVDVQNRVALAEPALPEEVRRRGVKVRRRSSDMLMVVNLVSPDNTFDGLFLSNYAGLNVQPELARVFGVGDANIIGALDYGMRIWIDPVRLANLDLTVNDVLQAIREQNAQVAVGQLGAAPALPGTEFQYVLSTKGRLASVEEFENIVVRADAAGNITRLADVSRVELGSQSYKGTGNLNNQPGVILAIYKIPNANSLATAKLVRAKMEELSAYFPDGIEYVIGHDTTEFIEASLEETVITLVFTIALVIGVTYLFLGSFRATLIPTIAVPVSIIGTLAVLNAFGMTINTVTLFALILAIGVVVDDAIIVVENVERLMEEEGLDPVAATRKAMQEVSGAIIATSLVLVAVFGPTMLLPGITGRMFGQFGTTLVVAVLISTVNAMTLSPALAATVLRPRQGKPNPLIRGFNAVFESLRRGYVALVGWLASHLVVSAALIVGLFASLVLLFRLVPTSFIPEEDKGFFLVDVQLPPAASLLRTEETMERIVARLMEDPNIENVVSVNGFSIINVALQSNAGMVIAKLKPWSERSEPEQHQLYLQQKYQREFATYPDAQALVFGAPAIPGLGAIAGISFVVEDTLGRPPDDLAATTQGLIQAAMQQPEIARGFTPFRSGSPQIFLEIDRVRAKSLGVSLTDVFAVLQTQLGGYYVNDFNLFGETFKVMAQADAEFRQDENALRRLYVRSASGEQVPISAIVTTEPTRGPDILYRYNMYNSATITGIPADGYSSGAAMNAMESAAAGSLPEGYRYDWTASSYEERKSGNAAPIALGLSLVFTFLFLAALYESFLTPFAIVLTVPLAMIGALLALLLRGEPLSLYGQIGLVMLIGLSAKAAILIVEYSKALRERDGLELNEATSNAAGIRFRAVMMTGLSFVVGVIPLIIASGAGAASRISLGLAVFGGTIAAALLGTLLAPIFFRMIQGLREKVHRGPTRYPGEANDDTSPQPGG